MTGALRTVYMGTPELAVPALEVLAARTSLQLVVTQPDRPAGRGRHLKAPPVKEAALRLGLPVWQPETLRHTAQDPRFDHLDLIVVMAYGEILRQRLLDRPRHGCLNLHCYLLPRWRGASPLQAAIRAGDLQTGVSVMRMVRALDAGPVFHRRAIPVPERADLSWLHDRLALLSADALNDYLDRFPGPQPEPQDPALVSVCHKLTHADGHLDFSLGCCDLDRQVRAYTPAPGCWAMADGQRLGILAVEPLPEEHRLESGLVLRQHHELLVGCRSGALRLMQVQPSGKRAMAVHDFLNGHPAPTWLC